MSFIRQIVTSLDARLDELASEIATLQGARMKLQRRTLAPPGSGALNGGAPARRSRRAATPAKTSTASSRPNETVAKPEPKKPPAPRPTSEASGPHKQAADRSRSSDRDASSLSAEQLVQLLTAAGSAVSATVIVEQTGVPRVRVLTLLRELEDAGTVRRTGQRRSTLWSAVTDEHRTADRTAELERQFAARRVDRTQRRGRARAS
jgi:hypothetical protein